MNNKFKISVILKDIMNWFICSCGIVLLLMFFNHEVKEQIHSDRDVIHMVSIYFVNFSDGSVQHFVVRNIHEIRLDCY